MSLDDTLRWAKNFPPNWQAPDTYSRPEREDEPNWRWVELWHQENPYPGDESFEDWYDEKKRMDDRVWVAYCLPDFRVWDWPDDEVALARSLVSGHVCGVCGRVDDAGCFRGC